MRTMGVIFCLIFGALLLASCGLPAWNLTGPKPGEVPKREKRSKSWDANTMVHESAAVREKVNRLLEKQDYPAALIFMQQEVSPGAPQSLLEDEYLQALNGTLELADNLLKESHSEQAGILFRAALTGFPRNAALGRRAGRSVPEILAKIETCATLLMEKGLMAYRAGDLDRAIEEWKKIQAFQPGHQASRHAIDTTNVQRSNLKRIGMGK